MAKKRRPPARGGSRPGQRPGPRPATVRSSPAGGTARARAADGKRPLPAAPSWYTPGGSAFRHRIERASAPYLVVLHRLPRLAVALAPLVLLVLGVVVPVPYALLPLAVLFVLVGWLAFISWPALAGGRKLFQGVMLLLVVAIAVGRVIRG